MDSTPFSERKVSVPVQGWRDPQDCAGWCGAHQPFFNLQAATGHEEAHVKRACEREREREGCGVQW